MTTSSPTAIPEPTTVHQLSQLLLHVLGKTATVTEWKNVLKPLGPLTSSSQGDAIGLEGTGFRLRLVEIDDAAMAPTSSPPVDAQPAAQDPLWGLQSVQIMTRNDAAGSGAWPHEWPLGLQAADLGRGAVLKLLGSAVVNQKTLSLFECNAMVGEAGSPKPIGVQCEWGSGQQLARLTLLRLQDFVPLAPVEFAQSVPPQTVAATPPPAPTCRSEEPTPVTGIYEAKLPAWHPDFAYYSAVRGRFCFKKQGEKMIRFGVVPFKDEALVVWTWVAKG